MTTGAVPGDEVTMYIVVRYFNLKAAALEGLGTETRLHEVWVEMFASPVEA